MRCGKKQFRIRETIMQSERNHLEEISDLLLHYAWSHNHYDNIRSKLRKNIHLWRHINLVESNCIVSSLFSTVALRTWLCRVKRKHSAYQLNEMIMQNEKKPFRMRKILCKVERTHLEWGNDYPLYDKDIVNNYPMTKNKPIYRVEN